MKVGPSVLSVRNVHPTMGLYMSLSSRELSLHEGHFRVFARCMETFAKNLDDSVEEIARDGATISGRSARIKRRIDMILEEIHGVQMTLAGA